MIPAQATPRAVIRAHGVGWRAHAALEASGGPATVIAPLSTSLYAEASGQLLWVGGTEAPMHPRAVFVRDAPVACRDETIRIVVDGLVPWRPIRSVKASDDAARILRDVLRRIGDPRGLAGLVVLAAGTDGGATARHAHDRVALRARPYVAALGRACADGNAAAFTRAAWPLLGLGTGFTPSGDDFVGGALFARRVLVGMDPQWEAAATGLVADAARLTHPISARLMADLASGEGWAPLHALSAAIARDDVATAVAHAHTMTAIGHSSGWDVVAGMLAGLGVTAGPARVDDREFGPHDERSIHAQ